MWGLWGETLCWRQQGGRGEVDFADLRNMIEERELPSTRWILNQRPLSCVNHHVLFRICGLSKCLITKWTFVWPFSRMNTSNVRSQSGLLLEHSFAIRAWNGLFSSMVGEIVTFKAYLACKWLLAWLTFKNLVRLMCYHMLSQCRRVPTLLVTFWAFVWFLSCVPSHMYRHMLVLSEAFIAKRATVRFFTCVDPVMNLQKILAWESFITFVTTERLFISMFFLEMRFQAVWRQKNLRTYRTKKACSVLRM